MDAIAINPKERDRALDLVAGLQERKKNLKYVIKLVKSTLTVVLTGGGRCYS